MKPTVEGSMNVTQIAAYLGITPRSVHRYRAERNMPARLVRKGFGRELRFDREEVDRWLAAEIAKAGDES